MLTGEEHVLCGLTIEAWTLSLLGYLNPVISVSLPV